MLKIERYEIEILLDKSIFKKKKLNSHENIEKFNNVFEVLTYSDALILSLLSVYTQAVAKLVVKCSGK